MAAQPEASKKPADPKKAADEHAAADAKPARKSGKLMLLAIIAVVLLGGIGGGVYAFLPHGSHESKSVAQEPAVFVPLEAFTVNLLPVDGMQQYLQVNVTLKIAGQAGADAVKTRMPEVRSRIVMLLSGKRADDLLSTNGKEKLAVEVGDAVRKVVEPAKEPAKAEAPPAEAQAASPEASAEPPAPRTFEVLFTGFIIQ